MTSTPIIKPTPSPVILIPDMPPTTEVEIEVEICSTQKKIQHLKGINLGNALDAPNPGEWGVTIEENHFNIIKTAGFNAIRIPTRFSAHTGTAPHFQIDRDFMNLVDNAIILGLENNFFVILDLHHFNEIMDDPQSEKERFLAIWRQLAKHYQDAPPKLFFELLNEPARNMDADTWNELVEQSISIIRETNPDRKIIIGGINYSDINSLYLLNLPCDENLIATFHYYEPFEFTHQGASWVHGSSNWLDSTWEGTLNDKMRIAMDFDQAALWSIANKTPIIMGEFGAINNAELSSRVRWTRFIVQEAEKRNIGWLYWDFYTEFSMIDIENEVWDNSLYLALFGHRNGQ